MANEYSPLKVMASTDLQRLLEWMIHTTEFKTWLLKNGSDKSQIEDMYNSEIQIEVLKGKALDLIIFHEDLDWVTMWNKGWGEK